MIEIKHFGKSELELENLETLSGKAKEKLLKKYEFFDNHQYVNENEIKDFESTYNIQLPLPYIEFLKKYNGGTPTQDCYGDGDYIINFFFSLVAPQSYVESIVYVLKNYQDLDYKKQFFPIASAGGGDYILLKITEPNYGAVYYWDHNLENDEENPLYLEKNLTDFLATLHKDDE